jgi:hypothetical protein
MAKYMVRVNRRVKNVHIYKVLKRSSGNINVVTKLFMRIFTPKKKEEV